MSFFTKKTFESVIQETATNTGLKKTLTWVDLIMFGLGSIVGTGVFVFTGVVAAQHAGPAVTLSYAIAGVICIFVALAYSELAVLLPTSGSVYTYSYVAFGEIFAWLIGSVVVLELAAGSAAVAAGWSAYMCGILESGGINIPMIYRTVPSEGGFGNWPAIAITMFIGFVLYLGTKDSKRLNAVLVCIKMAALLTFIVLAIPHFNPTEHWQEMMPFGLDDVFIGSSILFFAFTGFGGVATAAEECKNPKRDLTIGIIGSLVLSSVVYIVIAGLLTGIADYRELGNAQSLAYALRINGSHLGSAIVATGAVCAMTTVLLMQIFAATRLVFAIARDGLFPKAFTNIHPKHASPYVAVWFFAIIIAIAAGFVPYKTMGQLASMSALLEYSAIAIVVMLFRFTLPNAERNFKCPAIFIIAPISLLACLYLLSKQVIGKEGELLFTGEVMIYWFIAMFALYFVVRKKNVA